MYVRVLCSNPSCRQEYRIKPELLGKSGKCKACGQTFIAKNADEPADAPREISMSMLKDEPPPKPTAPSPAAPSKPPTAIGRFELREKLGSGAFGTVYLAHDPQLQRDVAIKVPQRTVLGSPQRIERFLREARSAAKLRHPNIVPVYDAGQSGNQLYIASAFVKGQSLSELVDDGGIELKKAAIIVRSLAEGLAYAHQEGVVHRDVKPANVMLDELGQPLLMDFGLAAQVDATEDFQLPDEQHEPGEHESSRLTRAGAVMGTPSYMAPEIAGGLKGEAKPAADQFALGVVLFELITGRTPFEGPPAAVLHQVVNDPAPSPKEFRKDLPIDLETICRKAMAKDPADRYVTCYALAEDLRRWLEGEPIRARRLAFVERARRWMKKEPKLAMLGGGMVAAVVVIIGLLAVLWMQSSSDRDAFAADRDRAARDRDDTETRRKAEQDAAEKALADQRAANALDLVGEKLAAGDSSSAYTMLNQIPPEQRGAGWPFLVARTAGLPEFRRLVPTNRSLGLGFQLDSRHLLQVADSGWLLIRDVWTGRTVRELSIARTGLSPQEAAISGDGKRIAIAYGRGYAIAPRPQGAPPAKDAEPEIVIWDIEGKIVRVFPGSIGNVRIALNGDGSQLATAGSPGAEQKLSLWNLETGERLPALDKVLASAPFPLGPIAFSPDGKLVATTTALEKGEIRAWDIATGEERFVVKDRGGEITHLAFSPDGTRLAAAGGAELEGPEYTTEQTVCEPQTRTRRVEIDGVAKDQQYTVCISKQVVEKHVGYRNPRLITISKPVCATEKKVRTVPRTVNKQVTTYETRTVRVEKEIDGKKTLVDETVKVPVQKTYTETVYETKYYEVVVTKPVFMQMTAVEPIVRIWDMDGVLRSTIVEADRVSALAWRDDGALLATACDRKDPCRSDSGCNPFYCGAPTGDHVDVNIWDPVAGKRVFSLPCSTEQVSRIAFSPDRKHIAVAAPMGITQWSTESRSLVGNLRGDGPITGLLFSPDSLVLSAHSKCNQSTRLWDVANPRQIARLSETAPFMQFLPDSRFLTGLPRTDFMNFGAGPSSPPLGCWSARDGALQKHPGDACPVWAYTAAGTRFVSGSVVAEKELSICDGRTGAKICDLADSSHLGSIRKLQISVDGSRVAALSGMEAVLWEGGTGKVLARKWNATQADLSADGKSWVVATRLFPDAFPAPPNAPMPAAPVEKAAAAQTTDDDSYFVVQKVDPAPQPKPVTESPKVAPKAPPGIGPVPIPVAPPQTIILLFDGDGKELVKLQTDFTNEYTTLAFDPMGKRIIGVADGASLRIWDVATRKLTAQYLTAEPDVAISPDGRFLAYLSERPSMMAPPEAPLAPKAMPKTARNDVAPPVEYVVLQPAPTPAPQPPAPVPGTTPAMMAPAMPAPADQPRPGERQTTWVMVVELATGKLIWQSNVMGTGIGGMAFSADGKRLALGFVDEEVKNDKRGYVQVWDTAAPANGQTFKYQGAARYSGHLGAVNAVAFSPDGKLLASGGDDRIVKVWKLPAEGEQGPGGDIGIGFPAAMASPGAPMMAPPALVPATPPAPAPSPGK